MTNKFNAGTLKVFVRHSQEYFSRTCRATIPEYWEAEVEMTDSLLDHFNANNNHTHLRIYGTSQDSEKDAIQDCISELQKVGLTGKLQVIR